MDEDRKTPEQRAQMTDIERLRHSTAHVLATAILKIWPEAQFAAGPPVDNGFYYDVDLPHRISPEDFEKIEAEMKNEIKANHPFERMEVSRDEALALGKELELFVFDDDVGPGLPMFLPRGAVIAEELEKLAKETEFAAGYLRVRTPQIARESMYLKSGHLPYYAESMFPPMKLPASEESLARLVLARDDYEAALFAAEGLQGIDLGAVSDHDRGKVDRLFSGYWAYMRLL